MIRLTDEGYTDDEETPTVFGGGVHYGLNPALNGLSMDEFSMQEREGELPSSVTICYSYTERSM